MLYSEQMVAPFGSQGKYESITVLFFLVCLAYFMYVLSVDDNAISMVNSIRTIVASLVFK